VTGAVRPTLLIVSFSRLASDARVLKQIERFAGTYRVTTCGYGPTPDPRVEHVQIEDEHWRTHHGRYITLRTYPLAHRLTPKAIEARKKLRGRRFDLAIANDPDTIPLAFSFVDPSRVLADLHEYSPRLHEDDEAWSRRIAPYYAWLCRRYAGRAGAATTVSQGLADEYERALGVRCEVVTNAAPYADLVPAPVGETIRLVHSGACLRNRNLMLLLDAVELATAPVSLDLYLAPNDPGYLAELRERATGIEGVRVNDAVPYSELVGVLNGYDVGVHVLPPVNFNNRWALPNKFFDYVQARLGLLVGPSPEMATVIEKRGLGLVAADFTAEALAACIDELTPGSVTRFKAASHEAARDLSADAQVDVWERILAGLLEARA
jgi:hypothetical protein